MKVLLFGRTGQLAQEVQRHARGTELEVLGREDADFTDPAACAAHVMGTDAQVVINAVAYTAVDRAEEDEETAMRVNAAAPGAIAWAAATRGLPMVHISTDYVFDGAGQAPFAPGDTPAPLGAYGRSKLGGEEAVRAAGGVHVILRTSWVVSAHGRNFVKTMLRLGAMQDRLSVVADQIGGPTCAADIAQASLAIARQLIEASSKSGTYHFSGAPDISWAGFARAIFAQSGLDCEVEDIPSAQYPTPAPRPLNSRLDNSGVMATFGIERPDWQAGLSSILTELSGFKT